MHHFLLRPMYQVHLIFQKLGFFREIPQILQMLFEHKMIRKMTKKLDILLKVARSRNFIFVPLQFQKVTKSQLDNFFYFPNVKS